MVKKQKNIEYYSNIERIQLMDELIKKIKMIGIEYSLNRLDEYRPIVELYKKMHRFIETGESDSGFVKFTDDEWKGGCRIDFIFNNNKKYIPSLQFKLPNKPKIN